MKWKINLIDLEKLDNFFKWLNNWADVDDYPQAFKKEENKPTELSDYGLGYKQALNDVCYKLDLKPRD